MDDLKNSEEFWVSFINKIGEDGYGEVWKANVSLKRKRRLDKGEIHSQRITLELACKILSLKTFSRILPIFRAVHMLSGR
jgi:hypothetical protein